MGGHAGKPCCRRPDLGGDGLALGGVLRLCSQLVAGLSHSGRGSWDLKLVSDGWDELLGRTGSGLPWDTRSVRRSLVRPSARPVCLRARRWAWRLPSARPGLAERGRRGPSSSDGVLGAPLSPLGESPVWARPWMGLS